MFVPSNSQNEFTGEVVSDSCRNSWGCDRGNGYCVEGQCQDRFPMRCEDTDGGKNVYEKGTKSEMGRVRTPPYDWYEMKDVGTDYCINSRVLAEYFCPRRGDMPVEFWRATCLDGKSCIDGACFPPPSSEVEESDQENLPLGRERMETFGDEDENSRRRITPVNTSRRITPVDTSRRITPERDARSRVARGFFSRFRSRDL